MARLRPPGRLARNAAEVNSWPALFAEGAVVGVNNEFVRLLVRNETSSLDRFGFGVVSGAGVAADLDLPLVAGWDYVHVCYWGPPLVAYGAATREEAKTPEKGASASEQILRGDCYRFRPIQGV